jgi:hypothetical protein
MFKQSHLLTTHQHNFFYRPPKELFPSTGTPEKLACCDTASFVDEGTDDAWVQGEAKGFVAVSARCGEGVGVDCYSTAVES